MAIGETINLEMPYSSYGRVFSRDPCYDLRVAMMINLPAIPLIDLEERAAGEILLVRDEMTWR